MALSFSLEGTWLAAWVTVLAPFLSFVVIILFGRPHPRFSSGLSIAAASVSVACASFLLLHHWPKGAVSYMGTWLVLSHVPIPFGFLLDPLSLLMLFLVALIAFLVPVSSLGYMADDPGFSRYYAFQSLFAGAMLGLCISPSMIQLYVFWELVGLTSYLLIGFWYERFLATEAGKKAFVMTRAGDICLFAGILLVLLNFGSLDIQEMNSPVVTERLTPELMTLCALLIFGGIVGKSAQFPLLTWLPDAMEGPTPVSALLHSATMVAAGAFLLTRLLPFMSHSATAMTLFLSIGTITMLLASTMALVERDIKKVWAYSTVSQLGLMVMALGAGGDFAGFFHLSTHAAFKSLLFLCSGVWIHLYQTNDLFAISAKGGRRYKIPMICMILAAASLSGLPPLSGFFSKETILDILADRHNPVWLLAALAGAFLTPYYAFRAVFILCFPRRRDGADRYDRDSLSSSSPMTVPHQGNYWTMAFPLLLLAGIVMVVGFLKAQLEDFLTSQTLPAGHQDWLSYASVAVALCSVGLAWFEFGRRGAAQVGFLEKIEPLRKLFAARWYLDHFYRLVLQYVVYRTFANLSTRNDRQVIDAGIDAFCGYTVVSGRALSRLQSGLLRNNFLITFVALALLALWFCLF